MCRKKLEFALTMEVSWVPMKLLLCFEENGGRWGEIWLHPSPFYFFSSDHAHPGELNFFFCKFFLQIFVIIVVIYVSLLNLIITYKLRRIHETIQENELV